MNEPTVPLGPGNAMPLLGLGTWQMRGSECRRAVRYAIDVGYRHLDTATMYRNEGDIGRAIGESGIAREELFITTKVAPNDAGRERRTLESSLRALGTDYVNLWLVHWPPGGRAGARTWQELVTLRDEGKARAVGVSNYGVAQIDELARSSGATPQVNQIRWGPSLYDAAMVAEHRRRGVVLEGYSPFKSTDLRHPVLVEIADDHAVTDRPGRDPMAHRPSSRGDPEVGRARADRVELRRLRFLPRRVGAPTDRRHRCVRTKAMNCASSRCPTIGSVDELRRRLSSNRQDPPFGTEQVYGHRDR